MVPRTFSYNFVITDFLLFVFSHEIIWIIGRFSEQNQVLRKAGKFSGLKKGANFFYVRTNILL